MKKFITQRKKKFTDVSKIIFGILMSSASTLHAFGDDFYDSSILGVRPLSYKQDAEITKNALEVDYKNLIILKSEIDFINNLNLIKKISSVDKVVETTESHLQDLEPTLIYLGMLFPKLSPIIRASYESLLGIAKLTHKVLPFIENNLEMYYSYRLSTRSYLNENMSSIARVQLIRSTALKDINKLNSQLEYLIREDIKSKNGRNHQNLIKEKTMKLYAWKCILDQIECTSH